MSGSHIATHEWQSFEMRMRRRRAERCLLHADVAIEAGFLDDAAAALNEARALDPSAPRIAVLDERLNAALAAAAVPSALAEVTVTPAPADAAVLPELADAALLPAAPATAVLPAPTPASVRRPLPLAAIALLLIIFSGASSYVLVRRSSGPPPAVAQRPAIEQPSTAPATHRDVPVAPRAAEPPPEPPLNVESETVSAPESLPPTQLASQPDVRPTPTAGQLPERTTQAVDTRRPPAADTRTPVMKSPPPAENITRSGNAIPASTSGATAPVEPPASKPAEMPAMIPTVPAPSAAVETTPPPTPPPPPAPAEDARIRAVLSRYEAAYSQLDAAAAAAVWPRVDRNALARAFEGLSSQRISLGDCRVNVNGSAAEAECSGSATWTPKVGGGAQTQQRRWRFELRNAAGTWQIARATAR